MPFVMK